MYRCARHARRDNWAQHFGLAARFEVQGDRSDRLAAETETVLYRIVQEALNNIVKHARAGAVLVVLEQLSGEARLTIQDDGVGFDAQQHFGGSALGVGLVGMRERAALVGGSMQVDSKPGGPTRVSVRLPAAPTAEPGSA